MLLQNFDFSMIYNSVSNEGKYLCQIAPFLKAYDKIGRLTSTQIAIASLLKRCGSITQAGKHQIWLVLDLLAFLV